MLGPGFAGADKWTWGYQTEKQKRNESSMMQYLKVSIIMSII